MNATGRYAVARAFLDEHAPSLAERAWQRIAASEADYGDSYLWTARRHLIAELGEELIDGAAWAALIADRLSRETDATPGARDRATALLAAVAALCAQAARLVSQLGPLIAEAEEAG